VRTGAGRGLRDAKHVDGLTTGAERHLGHGLGVDAGVVPHRLPTSEVAGASSGGRNPPHHCASRRVFGINSLDQSLPLTLTLSRRERGPFKIGTGWFGAVEAQLLPAMRRELFEGLLSIRERNKVRGSD
jgi:hypothetical protein